MRNILVLWVGICFSTAALGQTSFTSITVNVSAEVVQGGPSSLQVTPSLINFPLLEPSLTNHRFQSSGSLTCEFFAATSPWSIQVFTDDLSSNNFQGLVSGELHLPQFKFHQANFGGFMASPTNDPDPDPELDVNWTGSNAVWKFVFEADAIAADTNLSASTLGSSEILDSSPIIFDFAIDAIGVASGVTYGAAVNFVIEVGGLTTTQMVPVMVTALGGEGLGAFLAINDTNNMPVSTIDFDTMDFSPTNHRFQSDTLLCSFFPPNSPWTIEVSHQSGFGSALVPLDSVGNPVSGRDPMNLKFNQPNFGPGDPEDDNNWVGSNAVWRTVADTSLGMAGAEFASSEDDVPPEIEFSFAVDIDERDPNITSPIITDYSGDILFDIVVE